LKSASQQPETSPSAEKSESIVSSGSEVVEALAVDLQWLLFDVDGVLTDGRLYYGSQGEEWKCFDVRDGFGLKLAQRDGLKIGLLSGRECPALVRRAEEMEVDALVMNRLDKATAFHEILAAHSTTAARVAYMGDDIVDLPVLLTCGLSFAPADAAADVRSRVHHVLTQPGGRGAAREMVEIVLRARGSWDRLLADFLPPA
jgi:3-deoxy-D-manno-octulosonate 8-phosphate phosphatase (KDO 8-P phosphatase)